MIPWWTPLDTWIVVVGALSAMSCAVLGNFLILRKMSMMGDAISHAVLPGLAIAFLLSQSRASLPMFIGAVLVGLFTALLIHMLNRYGNIEEGASMGVVFTTLFAIGLILIRLAADDVDLDPDCVLYGALEYVPLDTMALLGWELPVAAVTNGLMLLVNVLFVLLFFKELKISSFDPALATTLGISANVMHYALMTLVAATTVAAFTSVGSILVIAMLIVPGAAAYLLTERLGTMIALSVLLAAAGSFLGHYFAIEAPRWVGLSDTSTAGMMASMMGLLFVAALLAAPRQGLVSRALARRNLARRILRDDLLGYLYRQEEAQPAGTNGAPWEDIHKALGGGTTTKRALGALLRRRLLSQNDGGYSLTTEGQKAAREIIQSHRLWEGYLVAEVGVRPDHVHNTAEQLEHFTDQDMRRKLDEKMGGPSEDPHQRPIPRQ